MVKRVVELLPADLPAVFLQVQAVGKSNEHISSPGTLTFSWETLTRVLLDIGHSVDRAGVRKLVFVNSHGGNVPVLDVVTRELRVRHDMLAVASGWSRFGYPERMFAEEEHLYGIHGGDMETSVMLHLRPDLVRMERAKDFRSAQAAFAKEFKHLRAHGVHQFGWKAQDLNPEGVVGNASLATAEKGKAVVELQAARFIELLQDVQRFDVKRLWRP
jgi:creatinine amidohydrolase